MEKENIIISNKQDDKRPYPRLDYTIIDIQERNKKVHEIINSVPVQKLTPYYLEQLTKYLTETTQTDGDKNILLVPKIQITENDIETIPGLKELREEIKKIEIRQNAARGKQKFLLTKQLIEMRQDQYV